ncbi:MAG TPA: O-methyltransferase [Candidatus Bipolaricaulota bacterium]
MFHAIPSAIVERMRQLEALDAQDRQDGTPQAKRLRQIPPETGKFIALLAATAPQGVFLEIGTSGGYSSLWLALACRELGRTLVTFEILPAKAQLARETFRQAQVEDVVTLIEGDARELLDRYGEVAFCFLDAEKEAYQACYELVIPRMVPGGLLVADNAINHREALDAMLQRALSDERVDAQIVPVGKGELVCRRRFSTWASGAKPIGGE